MAAVEQTSKTIPRQLNQTGLGVSLELHDPGSGKPVEVWSITLQVVSKQNPSVELATLKVTPRNCKALLNDAAQQITTCCAEAASGNTSQIERLLETLRETAGLRYELKIHRPLKSLSPKDLLHLNESTQLLTRPDQTRDTLTRMLTKAALSTKDGLADWQEGKKIVAILDFKDMNPTDKIVGSALVDGILEAMPPSLRAVLIGHKFKMCRIGGDEFVLKLDYKGQQSIAAYNAWSANLAGLRNQIFRDPTFRSKVKAAETFAWNRRKTQDVLARAEAAAKAQGKDFNIEYLAQYFAGPEVNNKGLLPGVPPKEQLRDQIEYFLRGGKGNQGLGGHLKAIDSYFDNKSPDFEHSPFRLMSLNAGAVIVDGPLDPIGIRKALQVAEAKGLHEAKDRGSTELVVVDNDTKVELHASEISEIKSIQAAVDSFTGATADLKAMTAKDEADLETQAAVHKLILAACSDPVSPGILRSNLVWSLPVSDIVPLIALPQEFYIHRIKIIGGGPINNKAHYSSLNRIFNEMVPVMREKFGEEVLIKMQGDTFIVISKKALLDEDKARINQACRDIKAKILEDNVLPMVLHEVRRALALSIDRKAPIVTEEFEDSSITSTRVSLDRSSAGSIGDVLKST